MTENLDGIEVYKSFQLIPKWTGTAIQDNYGGKPVVDYQGEPLFAELYALRTFINLGWKGVWVDTFRNAYRTELPEKEEPEIVLPKYVQDKLDLINSDDGLRGTWDLLLWKVAQFRFVELKRVKRDKVRQTQINILKKALSCNIPIDGFEIFEWELED